jgi:hypothetical protein
MRVNALSFIMFMVIGAPFSLKVEDKEVKILVLRKQMMNQTNFNIFYRVSEGAVITVFTLLNLIWMKMTKLSFVLIFMI